MDKPERIKAGQEKVKQLLRQGDYDGAIRILKMLDHPKVPDWISMVERKQAEHEFENALASTPAPVQSPVVSPDLPAAEQKRGWKTTVWYVFLALVLVYAFDDGFSKGHPAGVVVTVILTGYLFFRWYTARPVRKVPEKEKQRDMPRKEMGCVGQFLSGLAVCFLCSVALVLSQSPKSATTSPSGASISSADAAASILSRDVPLYANTPGLSKIVVLDAKGTTYAVLTYNTSAGEALDLLNEWLDVFKAVGRAARSNSLSIDVVEIWIGDAGGTFIGTVDAKMDNIVEYLNGRLSSDEFAGRLLIETADS